MATEYYSRPIDAHNGRQNVIVVDGIITDQELVARQGRYTGDGNPDWVGQPKSAIRGKGFRKGRGPQFFNAMAGQWMTADPELAY